MKELSGLWFSRRPVSKSPDGRSTDSTSSTSRANQTFYSLATPAALHHDTTLDSSIAITLHINTPSEGFPAARGGGWATWGTQNEFRPLDFCALFARAPIIIITLLSPFCGFSIPHPSQDSLSLSLSQEGFMCFHLMDFPPLFCSELGLFLSLSLSIPPPLSLCGDHSPLKLGEDIFCSLSGDAALFCSHG